MLQLEIRSDRVLQNYASMLSVGLDRNVLYSDVFNHRRFRNRGVQNKYIGLPELPYIFNLDKYVQNTIILQETEDQAIPTDALDTILNAFETEYKDNTLYVVRMFAYDYKILDNYFKDKGSYKSSKDTEIDKLFLKTMTDMKDRNGLYNLVNPGVRLYYHTEKNIIYEVLNYDDSEQASDYFLLLGVIPMLYPDIKNKLSDKEKTYLKSLIKRSQIKRIRNVEPENYYYDMYRDNKYQDRIRDLRLKAELETIIKNRTLSLRNKIDSYTNRRNNLLQDYETVLNELQKAQRALFDLEENDTFIEDVKEAMELPYVVDLHAQGENIYITIKSTLEFFDPELLEINLNNTVRYNSTVTSAFFKDVFIDQHYKFIIGNKFVLNMGEGNCRLPKEISYNPNILDAAKCLYNPHIEFYQCYGDNERAIVEAHQRKDIIGFINACLISLKNVNFADSPVFSRWYAEINAMLRNNYPGDNTFLRVPALVNTETGEAISITEWRRRYDAQIAEDAPELDVHEAGTEPTAEWQGDNEDNEEEEAW